MPAITTIGTDWPLCNTCRLPEAASAETTIVAGARAGAFVPPDRLELTRLGPARQT